MNFKTRRGPVFSWCPQDPKGMDHRILARELRRRMGQMCGDWWLAEIDRMASGGCVRDGNGISSLVQMICHNDVPELVELLYPTAPEVFLAAIPLNRCKGQGGALVQCALEGASACLETLLELGADPNGLDCEDWNMAKLDLDPWADPIPVTPLDCARAANQTDCCFLLELYGGMTMGELCGIPEEEMPVEFPDVVGPWELEYPEAPPDGS